MSFLLKNIDLRVIISTDFNFNIGKLIVKTMSFFKTIPERNTNYQDVILKGQSHKMNVGFL